jgi:hypothetical protein
MPPVDLASGDKHAPVKSAAARRPAVAPPSAIGLEVRPSFWLMRATTRDTDTAAARHRHAHARGGRRRSWNQARYLLIFSRCAAGA